LKKAVIILAGGLSKRFGEDKCFKDLAGKPLVVHVLDRVLSVAEERVIVVHSEAQQRILAGTVGLRANVIVDRDRNHSPLIGALTGFEAVQAECALLLPCDAAFVSAEIAALLLDLCVDRGAVIPRWPDNKIEPLQATYNVKPARDAARMALGEGKHDMLSLIAHLTRIRYVSTLVLQQFDEKLTTFFNINTVEDWKRAESMLKKSR
jgi:molybdopterin-guanine dinucleotide biosynthesis protein A